MTTKFVKKKNANVDSQVEGGVMVRIQGEAVSRFVGNDVNLMIIPGLKKNDSIVLLMDSEDIAVGVDRGWQGDNEKVIPIDDLVGGLPDDAVVAIRLERHVDEKSFQWSRVSMMHKNGVVTTVNTTAFHSQARQCAVALAKVTGAEIKAVVISPDNEP